MKIDRDDGAYMEADDTLTLVVRGVAINLTLSTTGMRQLAEELAAAAIRRDLRGAR